jgi:hypothetical protein
VIINRATFNKRRGMLFAGVTAVTGVVILVVAFAAGVFATFEPESGSLSGGATVVANAGASGGQAVKFGSGTAGVLSLPRIPWEGGSAYWAQFPKANAAGWDDPSFFPVSVFLSDPQHATQLKALGVNTYMGMNHDTSMLSYATTQSGMFLVAQQEEWTENEIGNNPNVVGWYLSDECEQGEASCPYASDDDKLAAQKSFADRVAKFNDGAAGDCPSNNLGCDGRFKAAGFANGILHTDFWSGGTNPATGHPYVSDHIALVDIFAADKYWYTSPDVRTIIPEQQPPEWPRDGSGNLAPVQRSAAYGWMADQQRRLEDPTSLTQPHSSTQFKYPNATKPQWGAVVETAMPLLGDAGRTTITPDQMEGVIWSNIIHEARGLVFFQHNNDDCSGSYSLVEAVNTTTCQQELLARQNKFKAATATIRQLAPVINSQSYIYEFNNGTDTMLKTYNGSAYIFADIGLLNTTGSKTFTLPTGVNGTTVTVVGEGRTIPVTSRTFTDNFAAEYTHHIYQVAI